MIDIQWFRSIIILNLQIGNNYNDDALIIDKRCKIHTFLFSRSYLPFKYVRDLQIYQVVLKGV